MTVHYPADQRQRWFLFPDDPKAPTALYCLPHSGAGATAYRAWIPAAAPGIVVRPLQPPGRESRIDEPPAFDVAEVADLLAEETRPYALYGHSFGALVGHAVVGELQRRGAALPRRLVVGGSRPPQDLPDLARRLLGLDDEKFLREVVAMGGTPAEILDHPALAALLVPVLRADFGWIDRYAGAPHDPVQVPIIGFAGTEDPIATAAAMAGWQRMTTRGYRGHSVPGGHFFHTNEPATVVRAIAADLTGEPR
ncbi:thioesterase II family protein [Plantactinospora sp. GCM10030261]|uniref:thioesterase II family protein n=1 Tax=Plantactinospora sp. GCM10030261 TaxID=3273420 RepID=UPI00360FE693